MFRLPPPYLWTPLSPQRVKGCSPLTIPKKKSKPKNASRFAKRIFLCFSHLRLRRRFHVSAELHALRGRNTCCEAANRRNEKKALSAATSFFPFRLPLRGLKGASSPFLATATTAACGGNREELLGPRSAGHECRPRHEVDAGYRNPSDPARRNRWCFSGSLLARKRELSPAKKRSTPAPQARNVVSLFRTPRFASAITLSIDSPPARYSAVPHPTATRRGCVPPAPSFSGGCGPASRGLPASGR